MLSQHFNTATFRINLFQNIQYCLQNSPPNDCLPWLIKEYKAEWANILAQSEEILWCISTDQNEQCNSVNTAAHNVMGPQLICPTATPFIPFVFGTALGRRSCYSSTVLMWYPRGPEFESSWSINYLYGSPETFYLHFLVSSNYFSCNYL